MHFKSLFAIAAVTLLPSLVFAGPGPLQEACRNDVKTLCGSIQPGGGRIRDCMMEHRAQISNSCKLAIAERILERSANRSANGAAGGAAR
jgi:hypothetical protein